MTDPTGGPDVTTHGPGEPELAVVGGVHGDEPSGVRAIERLRTAAQPYECGVKLVVANPRAVEAGERSLETDLGRSFPGDPDGSLEERLAARLRAETEGLATLSLRATHSTPYPVALVDRRRPDAFELAAELPVPHVVDHRDTAEGAFTACGEVVSLEAGRRGTDEAVAEAHRQAEAFLQARGALPGEPPATAPDYYTLRDAVEEPPGGSYELLVENFERTAVGEPFALADGRPLVAHWPFYPVFMSECGDEGVFGYRATRFGPSMDHVRAALRT